MAFWVGEKNQDEEAYLQLIEKIMVFGDDEIDRTLVGTRSLFGKSLEFDLRDGRFPLLTTKRVFVKGVIEELLWILRGCTDSQKLHERGVQIWDANGTREFLDGRGLVENRVGDLGPVYGFQWRHWGAEYKGCDHDYTGQGIDQVAQVIKTIKENPTDRRIILSAWNVSDLKKIALPPCHMMCQFHVNTEKRELSCMMTQRSCDMGLGVPFNIASYSLLTHIIARLTGLTAARFVLSLGNAHVYKTHFEGLNIQCQRQPRLFPKIEISSREDLLTVDDLVYEDFKVIGYDPFPAISMPMAV